MFKTRFRFDYYWLESLSKGLKDVCHAIDQCTCLGKVLVNNFEVIEV
jgi:hypothetical protein